MTMAAGRPANQSSTHRDAMLRRVAIVLSSLPAPIAAKLLGNIPPQDKQKLRHVITNLVDVDVLERQRAIEAFRVSIHKEPSELSREIEASDRFEFSKSLDEASMHRRPQQHDIAPITNSPSTARSTGSSIAPSVIKNAFPTSDGEASSPLSFLSDVDDQTLADFLRDEHPQAIALVMASIEPVQAGRVLPLLPSSLRTQTISRIGRLGEIPRDAAMEVASHLQSRLNQMSQAKSNLRGQSKLDAILATMPQSNATSSAASAMPSIAGSPPERSVPGQTQMRGSETDSLLDRSPKFIDRQRDISNAQLPAKDLAERMRVVRDENDVAIREFDNNHRSKATTDWETRAETRAEKPAATLQTARPQATPPQTATPLHSTDAIHQHLSKLRPIELCNALGKVETRDAMLTLCGLPNRVAEAALALLPKGQSRIVRSEMSNLSSLSLSDIDDAKERVARASVQASIATSEHSNPTAVAA